MLQNAHEKQPCLLCWLDFWGSGKVLQSSRSVIWKCHEITRKAHGKYWISTRNVLKNKGKQLERTWILHESIRKVLGNYLEYWECTRNTLENNWKSTSQVFNEKVWLKWPTGVTYLHLHPLSRKSTNLLKQKAIKN